MKHRLAPLTALLALGLAACGGPGDPMNTPTPDAGIHAPAPDAGDPEGDAGIHGSTPDAGAASLDAGASECPEGYKGPRCDQCAPGYQDGNGDGVCSLACDATGDLAPQCGHGRCFIDPTIDGRACACEEGYVGAACDTCDEGYADPTGGGVCARICTLDCGPYGACRLEPDDAERCECQAGYEGEVCELCAAGYAPVGDGSCALDTPDTAGLELWLDAADAASLDVVRGGAVSTWRDRRRVRGALALTAPAAARQPSYEASGLAGHPAVRFDGVDDRLSVEAFTAFGGEDYTAFVVLQPLSRMPSGVFSASDRELGPALGLALYDPDTRFIHGLPGMPNARDVAASAAFLPAEPMVLGVRRWTSGLLDHLRMYGRVGGDPLGIEEDDNVLSVGDLGALDFALGVGPGGGSLNGVVGELLVYRRALDNAEMQRVLEYLAAKWSVP
jgi:hypothetical protein